MTTDTTAARDQRAREVLAQAFERAGDQHAAHCIRVAPERAAARKAYAIPLHYDVTIAAMLAFADEAASQPREGGAANVEMRKAFLAGHAAGISWAADAASEYFGKAGEKSGEEAASKYLAALLPATKATAPQDGVREALTPSGDTKAAYSGEFKFDVMFPSLDEDDDEPIPHPVTVPWDTIKQIMAAISARAALASPSDTAGDDAEGLTSGEVEARAIIAEMVRLADMGFDESLNEPEENGNYAVYERAKRYLASTPAIRQDEPEGAGVPIPDGWALVPIDLTYHPAIREAGWKHVDTKLFHGLNAQLQAMWSAMLSASPRPAATDQAGEVERG